MIVVDKPAGVVVHPARGHRAGTLAQALAGRAAGGEEPERAGIVHRLDEDTSGLLVVARNDAAHRALKAALARRDLHREYIALVEGRPEARTGTIEAPIGRDRRDRKLMSIDTDQPREARTHFEITEVLAPGDAPAGRPRHRAHPPDPRPPRGDRPPRVRGPPVRRRSPPRPAAPVPPRRAAPAARIPSPARRSSSISRRCPRTWRAALCSPPAPATDGKGAGGAARPKPPRRAANRATGGRGREVRPA